MTFAHGAVQPAQQACHPQGVWEVMGKCGEGVVGADGGEEGQCEIQMWPLFTVLWYLHDKQVIHQSSPHGNACPQMWGR